MLGEYTDNYTLDEKLSIIQAYKKGGGVQGLNDIIDDEDDEEDEANGAQGLQGGNANMNGSPGNNPAETEEEEEMEINLDNPEDVKIIESEFRKLWEQDIQFQKNFGQEAFELDAL